MTLANGLLSGPPAAGTSGTYPLVFRAANTGGFVDTNLINAGTVAREQVIESFIASPEFQDGRPQVMTGFSESPEFQQNSGNDVFVISVYAGCCGARLKLPASISTAISSTPARRAPRSSRASSTTPEYRARFLP